MGKKEKINNNNNNIWDSNLEIFSKENISIIIPYKIVCICNIIQNRIKNNEFSILTKGEWENENFVLSEEYYIPIQQVTSTSVDFEEEIGEKRREEGWNVIIHSHPFSVNETSFSQNADEETINNHFECSLLRNREHFVVASLLFDLKDNKKLKIKVKKIEIKYPEYDYPTTEIDEKIKEKQLFSQSYFYHNDYFKRNSFMDF